MSRAKKKREVPMEIEAPCALYGSCGGCRILGLPYDKQLKMKADLVKGLLSDVCGEDEINDIWEGVIPSPDQLEYRNKMELSFGDEVKDGPLTLGMHAMGSFYTVHSAAGCMLVSADFRAVIAATEAYFREKEIGIFNKMRHTGYLRHLLVRQSKYSGEVLVDLVTSSDVSAFAERISETELLRGWMEAVLSSCEKVSGILHTHNDALADAVIDQGTDTLYGNAYITEELLGLKFKITPFSFFQTNSRGAEVLYQKVREYVMDGNDSGDLGTEVYDLYCGTGTITQIIAPAAGHMTGVEIVEEAVEAAKENAALNGLTNCDFVAGDVLKVLDDLEKKPDYIILDPPRDGVNPKALFKILIYDVSSLVYVSCKPQSLARDIPFFKEKGYRLTRVSCCDMFPQTLNIETIALLQKNS